MTAAVAALFADGPSTLRNIGSWRVKETDRIRALSTELSIITRISEAVLKQREGELADAKQAGDSETVKRLTALRKPTVAARIVSTPPTPSGTCRFVSLPRAKP